MDVLHPGDMFDRYVVEDLLGRGGMGAVYQALDTRLQRPVALKVLGTAGDEAVTLALREARAAASVRHPFVAEVYDAGEVEGVGYIVMELVPGASLRAFVGDASVDIFTRTRWLADVAVALAAAHQRDLVHRDVKPENVIIRDDGAVKVLDFGLARLSSNRKGPNGVTPSDTYTLVGTPAYMAPEHARGHDVDPRTDQFSWGVVAYELLRGVLPWQRAQGPVGALAAILADDPEPLPATAGIPAPVAAVVMRALSKSPGDRFPSMVEVVAELEPHAAPTPRERFLSSPDSGARLLPPALPSVRSPALAPSRPSDQLPARRSTLRPTGRARHDQHEAFDFAVIDRLFFVRLRAAPTAASVHALRQVVSTTRKEVGRPLIYVAQIPSDARSVPPEMRPLMADFGKHVSRLCERVHLAVEAPGFRGAILRSSITAVLMVTRERNVTIHQSLADAVAAARPELPADLHDELDALIARSAAPSAEGPGM
jgi:serine/threonine-protein kinase